MSEQLRQHLSALMDGEAEASDIDEVLAAIDDESLRSTWRRYHLARDSRSADGLSSTDLSGSIMAAIAEEPAHAVPTEESAVSEPVPQIQPVGRWQQFVRPLASFAVAASVAAVVVLGTQYAGIGTGDVAPVDTAGTAVVADSSAPVTLLGGAANLAGYATPAVERVAPQRSAAADYNALARERLQRYILSHAEEASLNAPQGMMPYARVATFESEADEVTGTIQAVEQTRENGKSNENSDIQAGEE
ncbi:MAG: RseA family anti-sigma factor [Pseudomonadota bacterium]